MTLADLRKLAIRRQVRIRFTLRNGMECVIDEQGVARVPALAGVPDFNLEEELAQAARFAIGPTGAGARGTSIGRDELAQMTSASASPSTAEAEEA